VVVLDRIPYMNDAFAIHHICGRQTLQIFGTILENGLTFFQKGDMIGILFGPFSGHLFGKTMFGKKENIIYGGGVTMGGFDKF